MIISLISKLMKRIKAKAIANSRLNGIFEGEIYEVLIFNIYVKVNIYENHFVSLHKNLFDKFFIECKSRKERIERLNL